MASDEAEGWRVSPGWALIAVVTVVGLGWLAPAGLALLGFLAIVIASHETGHLIAARRVGIVPTEFYWGFGPEVASIERGGCRYGVRALFLGGYVKLHGMTPSSPVPDGFAEAGTYRAASRRGRLATILAGPAVNLAMAVVAFAAADLLDGRPPASALAAGFGDLWFVVSGTVQALGTWVANVGQYAASVLDSSGRTEAPVRFLSPVAQAEVSGWAVGNGPATTLRWFAVLSSAVGAINLAPLPPLDGSHALVALVEGVLDRVRRSGQRMLDVSRLVPLAYLTIGVLVFLSVTALVLDIRDLV